jgi:hypothetical protein
MRIRLHAADRDPIWLMGDPGKDPRKFSVADQFSWSLSRGQQAQTGSDWETAVFADRKNQRVTLTVTGHYTFDSFAEKMDYLAKLMHTDPVQQLHRWAGDVWVRVDAAGGGDFSEYCLAAAVLSLEGVDTGTETKLTLTYRIQAGGISATGAGAFRLASFFCYTSYAAAEITATAAELDAAIVALGIPYTGGAIEFMRTNSAGLLQVKSFGLAGYGVGGIAPPMWVWLNHIRVAWEGDYGADSGVEQVTLGGQPGLRVWSGNEGGDAYVAINFHGGLGMTTWREMTGGFGGLIKPLRGTGGSVLVADIGG